LVTPSPGTAGGQSRCGCKTKLFEEISSLNGYWNIHNQKVISG